MNDRLGIAMAEKGGAYALHFENFCLKEKKIDLAIESETNGLRKCQTCNLVYKVINYPCRG